MKLKCSRKIKVLFKHREAPHLSGWLGEPVLQQKKKRKKDQKNTCAETKKPNEMRVSGREEAFSCSRSSLETIELAQGLVQSGVDLDVLLFSISQFLCNGKNPPKDSKIKLKCNTGLLLLLLYRSFKTSLKNHYRWFSKQP